MPVETQISRNDDSQQPGVVTRQNSVCAQLYGWTMTLELRYAVSRPGRKQLGLVGVQFEAVGRHPLTDVGDARLQLSRCSSDVCTKAVQIQL